MPPLRVLRHLPTEVKEVAPEHPVPGASSWGARQGIATLAFIIALLFAAAAAWSYRGEPVLPEFNPAAHAENIARNIDALTPVQAWRVWVSEYKPLAEVGFVEMRYMHEDAIRAEIERRRFFQIVMLSLAGFFTVVGLGAYLWPGKNGTVKR